MSSKRPRDRLRSAFGALENEGQRLSRYSLLLAVIVVAVLCVVLSLGQQPPSARFNSALFALGTEDERRAASVLTQSGDGSTVVAVRPGVGERDDLFACTPILTTTCTNLTQSPAVTESWPVLDRAGDRIAYYGSNETGTELFLLDLRSEAMLPLTVRADASGLHTSYEIAPSLAPAFSPDGRWIAFPAQKGESNVVELFVARDDGQRVIRVTDLGNTLRDYVWLDSETLIIAVEWSDETLRYWTARLESGTFRLEPLQ